MPRQESGAATTSHYAPFKQSTTPTQAVNNTHTSSQQHPHKQSITPTQAVDKVQANGEQGQRIINGQALALLMRLCLHY